MVARTKKGKEVRHYFIDCEKQLKEKTQSLSAQIAESEAIANVITRVLSQADLGSTPQEKANLLAGASLSVLGLRHPELRAELMEGHKLLAASTPTPAILLTPTSIGQRLNGISARTVNNLLIDAGLQTRVPKEMRSKGEPDYRPTEKGAQLCSNTLATGNGGDRSTYQEPS